MGLLIGITYCVLWYSSILAGYILLLVPLLPVLICSNRKYRKATDIVFAIWQTYPTALLETLCGCQIQVTGDYIRSNETSLLIMNHRTRTDWNFLWPALHHCIMGEDNPSYPTKFVLKDKIKHIPGAGWVMQLAGFLYIKRQWKVDKWILTDVINYFCSMSYKFSLLIFPEGTDFTESTKRASDSYAEKNNLDKYQYVLHPKTTGFSYIASQLSKRDALDAIYDVTLVYCDKIPQTEMDLLKGNFPKVVKFHFTRYPASILPKTEQDFDKFLKTRWLNKEKVLKEYHNTGNFLHGKILRHPSSMTIKILSLIFWKVIIVLTLYIVCNLYLYGLVVIMHTLLLVVADFLNGGFQNLEIEMSRAKQIKVLRRCLKKITN